jgi:NADH-quinone oxidoreductase subunit C
LRDDAGLLYNFMMDLTAVDYLGREPRFEVVYHLYSLSFNRRVRLKAGVSESDCSIDSIVSVWIGANWFEREVYDLYGITFKGHPEMRRILLYEGFEGHPLRKDYPLKKRQPLIGPIN